MRFASDFFFFAFAAAVSLPPFLGDHVADAEASVARYKSNFVEAFGDPVDSPKSNACGAPHTVPR